MKVLHVISSISRQGGGPSRSSQGLVSALHDAGVDVWLMTLNHGEEPWIKGCEQFINGGEFEAVLTKVQPDLVHLHGIWDLGTHRCAVICQRWDIPYIIAPRGMLEPWSLKAKWFKKRVARFLYQDRDLHRAAALHATAESEAAQFRALGFTNPIILSPNGVNVPDSLPHKLVGSDVFGCPQEMVGARVPSRPHRALFVSRMHPKKGVLELVESWARVFKNNENNHCSTSTSSFASPPWQCELVYTLNGDTERAYEAKVKQRILDLGMTYTTTDDTTSTDSSLAEVPKSSELETAQATPTQSEGGWRDSRTRGRSGSPIASVISLDATDAAEGNVSSDTVDLSVARDAIPSRTVRASCLESPRSDRCTCVPNFILTGPLNDDAKWQAYARADLFVLPTYSENFGIVVAEALWAGVPVITTKGTPWQELEGNSSAHHSSLIAHHSAEGRCGWWIDLPPTSSLDAALKEAKDVHCSTSTSSFASSQPSTLNSQLRAMGANGHALIQEKYTWPAIAKTMVEGYSKILAG